MVDQIPPRYADVSSKSCDALTIEHCRLLAIGETPKRGILYMGSAGTGKSYAMYACARNAIYYAQKTSNNGTAIFDGDHRENERKVTIMKFRTLLETFHKNTFDRGGDDVIDTISALCESWCLFIDDMTVRLKNQASESQYLWAYEAVNALADAWWDKGQPGGLYITTNNTVEELADAFGTPLVDRLRGICERIELQGGSKR